MRLNQLKKDLNPYIIKLPNKNTRKDLNHDYYITNPTRNQDKSSRENQGDGSMSFIKFPVIFINYPKKFTLSHTAKSFVP